MKRFLLKVKWKLERWIKVPYNLYLILRFPFLNTYVNIIPFYTWFGSIPSGWRKCFGIQMCKEIKDSIKRNNITDFGILDLKEKYGYLNVFTFNSITEVDKIIDKYEYISYHTCIKCGRPATIRTTGWVEPYCDDCIPENIRGYIDFGHKGMDWYGYTGNINDRPNWKELEEEYEKT